MAVRAAAPRCANRKLSFARASAARAIPNAHPAGPASPTRPSAVQRAKAPAGARQNTKEPSPTPASGVIESPAPRMSYSALNAWLLLHRDRLGEIPRLVHVAAPG